MSLRKAFLTFADKFLNPPGPSGWDCELDYNCGLEDDNSYCNRLYIFRTPRGIRINTAPVTGNFVSSHMSLVPQMISMPGKVETLLMDATPQEALAYLDLHFDAPDRAHPGFREKYLAWRRTVSSQQAADKVSVPVPAL